MHYFVTKQQLIDCINKHVLNVVHAALGTHPDATAAASADEAGSRFATSGPPVLPCTIALMRASTHFCSSYSILLDEIHVETSLSATCRPCNRDSNPPNVAWAN